MRIMFMPRRRGNGRKFDCDSFTMEQIKEFQVLPPGQRPVPPPSHGLSAQLDQRDLERRDKETQAWIVPTEALEGLVRFLGVSPTPKAGETEGQRRHALVHAIMREEKRLSKCPRGERWDRPGGTPAAQADKEER